MTLQEEINEIHKKIASIEKGLIEVVNKLAELEKATPEQTLDQSVLDKIVAYLGKGTIGVE